MKRRFFVPLAVVTALILGLTTATIRSYGNKQADENSSSDGDQVQNIALLDYNDDALDPEVEAELAEAEKAKEDAMNQEKADSESQNTAGTAPDNNQADLDYWLQLSNEQEAAHRAADKLHAAFNLDAIYFDLDSLNPDYAGMFISEESTLVVLLTNFDSLEHYQALLDETDPVEFREARYSYIELKKLADAFASRIDGLWYGYGVDQINNQIFFDIADFEKAKSILGDFESELGYTAPIRFENAGPYVVGYDFDGATPED